MRTKNRYILVIAAVIISVGLYHCVDPFTPEVKKYTDLLVIDGTLTDQPEKQFVTVSRTSDYNKALFYPENGCTVTVLDDKGNIYKYTGKGKGKYEAEFTQADLHYGTSYMLRVIANNGEVFESDFQTLNAAPPIDSVTAKWGRKVTTEDPVGINGYQFFVNTSDQSGNTKYYRWSMQETWEYHAPYEVSLMWDGEMHKFSFPDNRSTCWKTQEVPGIYTATTRDMSKDLLRNVKLNFVSTGSDRLQWRYSLLVREYSLSAEAYEFWSSLEKQNQQTGGLYETQPYTSQGNISCVSNPDEVVLGFFSVSGMSKKRILVGPAPEPVNEMVCRLDTLSALNPIEMYPRSSFPVYIQVIGFTRTTSARRCFDCMELGGVNVRPEYWYYD